MIGVQVSAVVNSRVVWLFLGTKWDPIYGQRPMLSLSLSLSLTMTRETSDSKHDGGRCGTVSGSLNFLGR